MLYNTSFSEAYGTQRIDREIGPPIPLDQRFTLGESISSPLKIVSCCVRFQNLMLFNTSKKCHLEMRPQGILVHFQSMQMRMVWCIPFYKLKITRAQYGVYTLRANGKYISIHVEKEDAEAYLKRLLERKADSTTSFWG